MPVLARMQAASQVSTQGCSVCASANMLIYGTNTYAVSTLASAFNYTRVSLQSQNSRAPTSHTHGWSAEAKNGRLKSPGVGIRSGLATSLAPECRDLLVTPQN